MTILFDILNEDILRHFDDTAYEALSVVLNSVIAQELDKYMTNPQADPALVAKLREKLGKAIEALTLPDELVKNGTIPTLQQLSPETVLANPNCLTTILPLLEELNKIYHKVRITIRPNTKAEYNAFAAGVHRAIMACMHDGIMPPGDTVDKLEANSFLFYQPHAKMQYTGASIVNSRFNVWQMCMKGLRYKKMCDESGIEFMQRRAF